MLLTDYASNIQSMKQFHIKTQEQNDFNTMQSHNTENVSCIDHARFQTALNGDIKSRIS